MIGFLVADVAMLVCFVVLVVMAFRTRVAWGFIVLFAPFGVLVFAIKHWSEVGKVFLLMLICGGACTALLFTSPPLIAAQIHSNPKFVELVKTVNPDAYKQAQKLLDEVNQASGKEAAKPTPREVRDLAENEVPFNATPPPDPNAAQRAAYVKHAKELNNLYQQLNAERPKLKPGSSAVAAFNTKAAHYQQGLQALAEEKKRLDALDHTNLANSEAAGALISLQTSARIGDYEAFAATLKKSLSEYRQAPAFPQIIAFVRPTLQQVTSDKVLAGMQTKVSEAAHSESDKTTRQIQGIVNQVPQMVVKPEGADSYHYGYHPGATKPDLNAENLIGTRELWKGEYASMDEAPGVFYRSADCEFNPQTKYFYTSRNVPKKRLSDIEYKELTRLYHLLGQQEKAVADVPPPTKDAERVFNDLVDLRNRLDGYAMK